MQSTHWSARLQALQLLQPSVALLVEPLGTATQLDLTIGCPDPGPQHTPGCALGQRLLEGTLQAESARQRQPGALQVIAMQMKRNPGMAAIA